MNYRTWEERYCTRCLGAGTLDAGDELGNAPGDACWVCCGTGYPVFGPLCYYALRLSQLDHELQHSRPAQAGILTHHALLDIMKAPGSMAYIQAMFNPRAWWAMRPRHLTTQYAKRFDPETATRETPPHVATPVDFMRYMSGQKPPDDYFAWRYFVGGLPAGQHPDFPLPWLMEVLLNKTTWGVMQHAVEAALKVRGDCAIIASAVTFRWHPPDRPQSYYESYPIHMHDDSTGKSRMVRVMKDDAAAEAVWLYQRGVLQRDVPYEVADAAGWKPLRGRPMDYPEHIHEGNIPF